MCHICAVPRASGPGNESGQSSGTNARLKAQLEEVRRTVADAKAQVRAASNTAQTQAVAGNAAQTQAAASKIVQTQARTCAICLSQQLHE